MTTNLADRGGHANPADNLSAAGLAIATGPSAARRISMPGGWAVEQSVERAPCRYRQLAAATGRLAEADTAS